MPSVPGLPYRREGCTPRSNVDALQVFDFNDLLFNLGTMCNPLLFIRKPLKHLRAARGRGEQKKANPAGFAVE